MEGKDKRLPSHPRKAAVMTTITRKIIIPKDRRIRLDIEAPPDCPEGATIITVVFQADTDTGTNAESGAKNGLAALYGKGKGQFTMSPDFDEPLDDFKEYM